MSKPNAAGRAGAKEQQPKGGEAEIVYTPQQALDFLNDLLIGKEIPISREECFAILQNVKKEDMEEMTLPLFDYEKGKVYNLLYHGTERKSIKGKEQDVATVEDAEGKKFITTAVVLITSMRNVTQLPAFCRVECNGKTKTSNGEYYDLSVSVFPTAAK